VFFWVKGAPETIQRIVSALNGRSPGLHLVINRHGEIIAVKLSAGNVDDRAPMLDLCQGLEGLLLAELPGLRHWFEHPLATAILDTLQNPNFPRASFLFIHQLIRKPVPTFRVDGVYISKKKFHALWQGGLKILVGIRKEHEKLPHADL
jgi:hypothetical protein